MSLATIDRYDRDRVAEVGGHAVVLGASIAGVLTARVLADAFAQVTIVDRDPLEDGHVARRGVPQAQHPHALLVAGQVVMEDLVPGFVDDLLRSGAVTVDLSGELQIYAADGFIAPGDGGMPKYFASRPLIERLVRARVANHDRVAIRPGRQITDIVADADGGVVRGVEVVHDGERETIHADLVVDATGRSSRSATWLERLGTTPPTTETVHVDLAYRTCRVRRPPDDRRAMLLMPGAPRTRGAALVPIENDRWLVTLIGMHGDHAPDDLDGLRAFADGLPSPVVREILDEHDLAAPDIAHYRYPTQTRRRFDRIDDPPAGLLATGDAMANFNPIYGQGMSVAALEALALHHALAEQGTDELAPRFYADTAKIVDGAWNIAAGGDFQFAQTEGSKPPGTDLVNRYLTRLHRKAHADGELADWFSRVVAMEEPATSLFRPRVVWRVLRPGAPGAGAASRP